MPQIRAQTLTACAARQNKSHDSHRRTAAGRRATQSSHVCARIGAAQPLSTRRNPAPRAAEILAQFCHAPGVTSSGLTGEQLHSFAAVAAARFRSARAPNTDRHGRRPGTRRAHRNLTPARAGRPTSRGCVAWSRRTRRFSLRVVLWFVSGCTPCNGALLISDRCIRYGCNRN